MRVWPVLGLGVALLASSAAFAQKGQTYPSGKSGQVRQKKSAPLVTSKGATGSTDAAKDLRRIEQQSARTNAKPISPRRAPGSNLVKADKSRSTPPITTSSGNMGTNTKGMTGANRGKNPYHGRLRQKSTH